MKMNRIPPRCHVNVDCPGFKRTQWSVPVQVKVVVLMVREGGGGSLNVMHRAAQMTQQGFSFNKSNTLFKNRRIHFKLFNSVRSSRDSAAYFFLPFGFLRKSSPTMGWRSMQAKKSLVGFLYTHALLCVCVSACVRMKSPLRVSALAQFIRFCSLQRQWKIVGMMRSGVSATFQPFKWWGGGGGQRKRKKQSRSFACGTSRQVFTSVAPSIRPSRRCPQHLRRPSPLLFREHTRGSSVSRREGTGRLWCGVVEEGMGRGFTPGENMWGFLAPR